MAWSATNIPKNPLDDIPVDIVRIVHMQACLLHCICKLRSCECQVLKGAGNAAVEGLVRHGNTSCCRDLGLGVDSCTGRLAIEHTGTVEYVLGVLLLMKEEPL